MTKPGWKTTEWWTTTASQLLALLTVFGVLTPQDAQTLEEAVTKIIAAAFLLGANAWVVVHYVKGRVALKALHLDAQADAARPPGPTLPLLLFIVLFAAGPARAEPPQVTTCLPWRAYVERRLDQLSRPPQQPAGDPELKELLRQLLALLQRQQAQPIGLLAPPQQALPIAGTPRQELPIAGAPKQELPIAGPPKQELPVPGAPRQDLPTPGSPRQQLPPGGPKPPELPGSGKPSPSGYQRYTLWRPSHAR